MFEKVIALMSAPFKKLKVFYQILIIAGVLLLMLGLEGVLGIITFGTMDRFSRGIFTTGVQQIYDLMELRDKFDELQVNYLSDLNNSGNTAAVTFRNVHQTIRDSMNSLENVSPENISLIETELVMVEKILNLPVNSINGKELTSALFRIKYASNSALDEIRVSTLLSLSKGSRYSDAATRNTLFLLIIGIGLAILFGLAIAVPIAQPLKSVGITANALAEGDFTKNIPAKGSVEVAIVIKSLNKAIVGLRELIRGINEQSNGLYLASQELKTASISTSGMATETARTMEELARASSEQTSQVNQVMENITSLANLVRKVSNEMKSVSDDSENIAQSAKLGKKVSDDVSNEIVKIYNTTRDVNTVINELDKTSEEIVEITAVIEGIAEQTTLLALNAAIEAARAGKSGKGFEVVASETGKLADQSKNAAQHIANLIFKMRENTVKAVHSISSEMTMVEAGKNMATEAAVTFENIFNKLGNILARIDSVAVSANIMAEKNESVISAVTNIASLSEAVMASTEEVSATAEEQSASNEQVSALAENLAGISAKLKKSVAEFQID